MPQDAPSRIMIIVGVPRSGTSVLHALACTDPRANEYVGEASYLRLMLHPFRAGANVFEKHTQYAFPDREAFRLFHKSVIRQVLDRYWEELGKPDVLVLKDPLMIDYLPELIELIDKLEIVAILRNPADVMASWLSVRRNLDRAEDIVELSNKHNAMLYKLMQDWDKKRCRLVSYNMLAERSLARVRSVLALNQIDPDQLWKRARKTYPASGDPNFMTPLYGQPLKVNNKSRERLSESDIEYVRKHCLPVCRKMLKLGGIRGSPYWS